MYASKDIIDFLYRIARAAGRCVAARKSSLNRLLCFCNNVDAVICIPCCSSPCCFLKSDKETNSERKAASRSAGSGVNPGPAAFYSPWLAIPPTKLRRLTRVHRTCPWLLPLDTPDLHLLHCCKGKRQIWILFSGSPHTQPLALQNHLPQFTHRRKAQRCAASADRRWRIPSPRP